MEDTHVNEQEQKDHTEDKGDWVSLPRGLDKLLKSTHIVKNFKFDKNLFDDNYRGLKNLSKRPLFHATNDALTEGASREGGVTLWNHPCCQVWHEVKALNTHCATSKQITRRDKCRR